MPLAAGSTRWTSTPCLEVQDLLLSCGPVHAQVVPIDYINTAMERLEKNDVHYRFSIDVQGSLLLPSA